MAQPKSILKKNGPEHAQVPPNVAIAPVKSDAEKHNLRTAIAHAEQIKLQKDISLNILRSIEELSELPATSDAKPDEVTKFKDEVALFQPSDYTALIEERNVNSRCGYTLCANAPRASQQRLGWLRSEGERRFCSNECARKAMYVKAQLNETPAWERRGGIASQIQLQDDAKAIVLPMGAKGAREGGEADSLAQERGDHAGIEKVPLVSSAVVEKHPARNHDREVDFKLEDFAHDAIEGYRLSSRNYGKPTKNPG